VGRGPRFRRRQISRQGADAASNHLRAEFDFCRCDRATSARVSRRRDYQTTPATGPTLNFYSAIIAARAPSELITYTAKDVRTTTWVTVRFASSAATCDIFLNKTWPLSLYIISWKISTVCLKEYTPWSNKNVPRYFEYIILVFLGGFSLHFLYHWKHEWILYMQRSITFNTSPEMCLLTYRPVPGKT